MIHDPRIAVIQFPGTNCELETARAVERSGMSADVFRWNEKKSLKSFDGAVLAGGFSYEDRGRSGLIASKDPLTKEIYTLAKRGGVVLGICNGAQILVETGLVPNFEFGKSTIALARNRRVKDGIVQGSGYFNDWVYVKPGSDKPNAFNQFDHPIRIPVAHGEGRFYSEDPKLLEAIVDHNLNTFVYCDAEGNVLPEFPVNPNGSVLNLAGISNLTGNVCALMPHPERVTDGDVIFQSMKKWITGKDKGQRTKDKVLNIQTPATKIISKPKVTVELFVKLKITDNEALSVGKAAGLELTKYRWFGIQFSDKTLTPQFTGGIQELEKIIRSGDILNTEKEEVFAKIGSKVFKFSKDEGLIPAKLKLPKNKVLAHEKEASLDESRMNAVNKTLGKKVVKNLISGVLWGENSSQTKFKQALKKHFFHHPAAHDLIKL